VRLDRDAKLAGRRIARDNRKSVDGSPWTGR